MLAINSIESFYFSKVNWKIRRSFSFKTKFEMEKVQNIDLKMAATKRAIPLKKLLTES